MQTLTIERPITFATGLRGLRPGPRPEAPPGTVPRLACLMALAIHFDTLIRAGEVADRAEMARLGCVSRARMSQVMALLQLAPDIQEAILHLPRTIKGRDPIRERHVAPIAADPDWQRQRLRWERLAGRG